MWFVLASFFCLNLFGATFGAKFPAQFLDTQPVRFEPNPRLGQPDSPVEWSARGPGYAFLFLKEATVLRTSAGEAKLTFPGSSATARFAPEHALSTQINYFRGHDHSTVTAYTRLRRSQIYPGIDLVYYGTGHDIEYDFEIAPGADASRIRMRYDGAQAVRLNDGGEIVLAFADGEITQRKPVVYQRSAEGKIAPVPAEYVLEGNGVARVRLGSYDRHAALVVDPTITYKAYVQGSSIDTVVAIGHDASGRVYMTGNTFSIDFPVTSQGYQLTFGTTTTTDGVATTTGIQNVWVMQLDPTLAGAAIVYCSYLGGDAIDTVTQMAVDPNGVMYITGNTDSGTYPVSAGAYNPTYSGNFQAFVSVVDPSQQGLASLIYSTFFGGTNSDFGQAIAVANGKAYVTGYTTSVDLPLVGNPYSVTLSGASDAFVAEFDPTQAGSASLIASTYLGGTNDDQGHAIAVDSQGNVYVAGQTFSFDFPTTATAEQPGYGADGDVFLAVLNLGTGTLNYATYFGGSSVEDVKKILITPAGNVAMTGYTLSSDFPTTFGAYQTAFGGNGNAFVSVINPNAPAGVNQGLVYSTYFGGAGGEVSYDLHQDAAGRFYFGGYTLSPNFPVTSNALYPASVGNSIDGFVAVLDTSQLFNSNALVYSSYITGPGMQVIYGVDVDQSGTIYLTGITTSDVFPNATPQNTYAVKTSVFVMLFTLP